MINPQPLKSKLAQALAIILAIILLSVLVIGGAMVGAYFYGG